MRWSPKEAPVARFALKLLARERPEVAKVVEEWAMEQGLSLVPGSAPVAKGKKRRTRVFGVGKDKKNVQPVR